MPLRFPTRLASALAVATLAVAACGGGPTAAPSLATSPATTTAPPSIAVPTTAATAPLATAPSATASSQGGPNGRIAYGVRGPDGFHIFSVLPDGTDDPATAVQA